MAQHNCGTDAADRGALAPLVGKLLGSMPAFREDRITDIGLEKFFPTCATMGLWLPVPG